MTGPNIKSVGIIGAGPGGLAALYELLHTSADGKLSVGQQGLSANPHFTRVVAFEQKDAAGGIWATETDKADKLPEKLSGDINLPETIAPKIKVPEGANEGTYEKPLVTPVDSDLVSWATSGVFQDLFTNIPTRFTRYLYLPDEPEYHDKKRNIYPFLTHQEQLKRLSDFIEREQLAKYIRTRSTVVKATKEGESWHLLIREDTDSEYRWYVDTFDAIVVSNGHYTVPSIPNIPGLTEFHNANPGAVLHAKLYRNHDDYKDKRVLVIGGLISSVNQLQYVVPVAKETVNSVRLKHIVFEWINDAIVSEGITPKPAVAKFNEDGLVEFTDGTTHPGFDKVILTTGYHYHYPFLDDEYLKVTNPLNLSRVSGLFYDTFSINDPTVGVVGVAISTLNFHTIEASAAAIAGVWSGAKTLPSKQEQIEAESARVSAIGDNLAYHYYRHYDVKDEFIDRLADYAPVDRPYVLRDDGIYLPEVAKAFKYQARLFYGLKDGTIPVKDTVHGSIKILKTPVAIV